MFKELISRALWLGALVIIASLSIACGDSQPATEVTLGEMARDYMQNAARADEKYSNPLMVSARINEIGSNGIIRLSGGGRNHVEARMKNKEDLLMLNRGDTTTLRCGRAEGSTDSLGAFIDLKDCEIWQDDKTDASSSKAPPVSKDLEDSPVSVVATMEAQNALALLPTSAYERVTANSGSTDDYVSSYKWALRWALLRGQTEAYAVGYAISRTQGSTDDQAKSYAEQFASLVEEGHSFDSAMRIVDASTDEASSDSMQKEPVVASRPSASGMPPTVTPSNATTDTSDDKASPSNFDRFFDEQLELGNSEHYATGYATYRAFVSGATHEQSEVFANYYVQGRSNGRSHDYASSYASMRVAGFTDESAREIAEVHITQMEQHIADGQSLEDARGFAGRHGNAYASAVKQGYSVEFAAGFATIYIEQYKQGLDSGMSVTDADSLARDMSNVYANLVILEGYTHDEAKQAIDSPYTHGPLRDQLFSPTPTAPPPITKNDDSILDVSLGEMAREYRNNAARADEKYNRPLLVSAKIIEVGSNGVLRLSGGGYNHVEASMKNREDLLTLSRGDTPTLRCERAEGSTDSLGAYIYFKGCETN